MLFLMNIYICDGWSTQTTNSHPEPVSALKDAQIWTGLFTCTPRSKVTLTIALFLL